MSSSSMDMKDLLNRRTIDQLKNLATQFSLNSSGKSKPDKIKNIMNSYESLSPSQKNKFNQELGFEKPKTPEKPKSPVETKTTQQQTVMARRNSRDFETKQDLTDSTDSTRLLSSGVSPTSKSSRRLRGGEYTDIAAKSSRRYLLPARLPGFRNFLCNMLEYKGEMKEDLKFYPIGYISYLLRAYSYDTSSITPINVSDDANLIPLLSAGEGIELKEAINFQQKEFRALYVKETDKRLLSPITIIYNSSNNKACTYMKKDISSMISATKQRFIAIFAREIIVDKEGSISKDTYLPIVIDQKEDRRTIDLISETDAKMESSMPKFAELLKNKRKELVEDLIELKQGTGKNYDLRMYLDIPSEVDPRVWQIMMVHLKLINQIGSFEQLAGNFLADLESERKNIKSIVYSYFMKIMRLSVNEQVDLDLLSIFHGGD